MLIFAANIGIPACSFSPQNTGAMITGGFMYGALAALPILRGLFSRKEFFPPGGSHANGSNMRKHNPVYKSSTN
jgi:hypothetical protein